MTTCNITEAARLLKVHEETVAEMIRTHKLPAAKIGRAWVMLERDVLEYIEAQTSAPHYPACAEPASPSAGKG